jgi:hypothetical protein
VNLLDGDGWRVELPDGLIARDHQASGYESGMIARGWLGDSPVTAVVQTKPLEGGFNAFVRQVLSTWIESSQRRVDVPNANDAIRADGIVEFDGLGARDDRERCMTVLAKRGGRVWSLTVRCRPDDGLEGELEPIFDSFALT